MNPITERNHVSGSLGTKLLAASFDLVGKRGHGLILLEFRVAPETRIRMVGYAMPEGFQPICAADTGELLSITGVQFASSRVQHTSPLSRAYPQGSVVMYVDLYKFYIDAADANHPNLMVQREGERSYVYAEDIQNLQFRYGLGNGVFVDIPPSASVVGEALITLTARTERRDLQFAGEYRRRTLASDVKVRNLGL